MQRLGQLALVCPIAAEEEDGIGAFIDLDRTVERIAHHIGQSQELGPVILPALVGSKSVHDVG